MSFLLIFCIILTVTQSRIIFESSYCYSHYGDDGTRIQNGFTIIRHRSPNSVACLIGDVKDVLEGKVLPGVATNEWSSSKIVGFGAGAIGNIKTLGEAFYFNGKAHVRSTDNSSEQYFQTISSNKFLSSFSVIVNPETQPDATGKYSSNSPHNRLSLFSFYQRVYNELAGLPFCYYGLFEFASLNGIAISKAPIYNEPVLEYEDSYYSKPPFHLKNMESMVFGCVGNFSTVQDQVLKERLQKVLYVNPLDPGSASELQVHSHALTVTSCNHPTKENAGEVYHLQSHSTIKTIHDFRVYTFENRMKLRELKWEDNSSISYFSFSSNTLITVSLTTLLSTVLIKLI